MPIFVISKPSSAALTGSDDASLNIVASATKPLRILMAKIGGNGTASAANEIVMQRSTGGATGGTALTPVKVNAGSAVASFTASYDATAGVTLTADSVLHRFTVNANGGIDPFVALPGGEFSIPVDGHVSFRSLAGTSNIIINVMIEEVDG